MHRLLSQLQRSLDSHKGDNGKVGVIGGSRDYSGAPALSAKAALRTGCDLTKILASKNVRKIIATYSENFLTESYPSGSLNSTSIDQCLKLIEWSDATVIGPGLGSPDSRTLKEVVERAETPLVIDADAIKPALEADINEAVFTPHAGEAELIKKKHGSIEKFVSETGAVVVEKGKTDRIYGEKLYENKTGTPAMTVGGTGDVLAGVIASLVSQGLGLEEAARLGTWMNGRAGELSAKEKGYGMLATDLIEKIPTIFVEND